MERFLIWFCRFRLLAACDPPRPNALADCWLVSLFPAHGKDYLQSLAGGRAAPMAIAPTSAS
jgi:hypothetical protein